MCLGIPGQLIEVEERHGIRYGKVQFGGISRDVCLECQLDAVVGDYVLVHVGFVIARIDREEADRTWATLEAIGQLSELEES